jgi:selenocysteine lyase/cysteine desulfurase
LQGGGVTRFSFGLFNTPAEIEIALHTLDRLARSKS